MRRCSGALHRWGFRFAESVFSCIILRFGCCDELHLLGKVSLRSSSFLQRFQLLGGLHGERRMLGGDALVQTLRLRDAVNQGRGSSAARSWVVHQSPEAVSLSRVIVVSREV